MIQPVFNILDIEQGEGVLSVALAINANSRIFDGHFPSQPVVPGACMLQLVKDVLSKQLSFKLRLLKADNIKFLGLLLPGEEKMNLKIGYQAIENQFKINATLSFGEVTSMKLQASFIAVDRHIYS